MEFAADPRFSGHFEKNRQVNYKIRFGENADFGINLTDFLKKPIEFTTLQLIFLDI